MTYLIEERRNNYLMMRIICYFLIKQISGSHAVVFLFLEDIRTKMYQLNRRYTRSCTNSLFCIFYNNCVRAIRPQMR